MPSLNLEIRRLYNTPKRLVKLKNLKKSIVLDFFFENGKIRGFPLVKFMPFINRHRLLVLFWWSIETGPGKLFAQQLVVCINLHH